MVKENKIYLRPCTLGFELANSHEHNIERKIMNGGELNPFGSSLDDGQWNGKTTQTAKQAAKNHIFSSPNRSFSSALACRCRLLRPIDIFHGNPKNVVYAAAVRCRSSAIWRRQRLSPWENIYERAKILWNFHIDFFFFSSFSFTSNDIYITHITLVSSSMRSYVSLLSFHISTRRRNVITLYGMVAHVTDGAKSAPHQNHSTNSLVWVDKCYGREKKVTVKPVCTHIYLF